MKRVPLNIFQKTQRLWDTLHPYNAAQFTQLLQHRSADQIGGAFDAALADLGVGEVTVFGNTYAFAAPGHSIALTESAEPVETLLTRLMNQPFDANHSMPFRPFVCRAPGAQLIGLVYQHWVADSVSIRLVMRQWLLRLAGHSEKRPVQFPVGGMLHYLSPAIAGWSPVAQTFGLLTYASRMKRMRRIETRNASQEVSVVVRSLPEPLIEPLRRRARPLGLTVGDVFIAAGAEALDLHGANTATPRRGGLAMGTIVDTRSRSAGIRSNLFGLFLGFTMTAFSAENLGDFETLLRRTARQRRSDLNTHAAEASQLNMAIGYAIAQMKGRESLLEFYRKRFPLAGGFSNVNLPSEWTELLEYETIESYYRVSPAGPLMPIVFTPTTLGSRLTLCCTYRSAVLSASRVEQIIATLQSRLQSFAGGH